MSKRKKGLKKFCDPGMCDDCIYDGAGDMYCERYGVQVVDSWLPTDDYLICKSRNKGGGRHESQSAC